ncbi:MAG: hypothetical protein JSV42_15945 [Chloroflexota bacterium]|nr:MAG: hypothetical protein JSV42_15945 [Chloroflexota bacterium]
MARTIQRRPININIPQVEFGTSASRIDDGVKLGMAVGVFEGVGVMDGIWDGNCIVMDTRGIRVVVEVFVGVSVTVGVIV